MKKIEIERDAWNVLTHPSKQSNQSKESKLVHRNTPEAMKTESPTTTTIELALTTHVVIEEKKKKAKFSIELFELHKSRLVGVTTALDSDRFCLTKRKKGLVLPTEQPNCSSVDHR